jgi:hypothetical protein
MRAFYSAKYVVYFTFRRSAHKIYKLLGGLWNSLCKVSAYGILFDQKPAYGIPLPFI